MTTYNPHKPHNNASECSAWTLIIVSEGVQCSNCGALVVDHRTNHGNMKIESWAESRVLEIVETAKFWLAEGMDAEHAFIMARGENSTLGDKYQKMALEKIRELAA